MLTNLLILLNQFVGRTAEIVLAPIAWLPGWLSVAIIGSVTGITMLWVFKQTSNQLMIKSTRNRIQSSLLALSLFRDDLYVCLRSQWDVLLGAGRLVFYSLVPMLVMSLPATLLLGQLSLWYQARPLNIGEESVVTIQLAETARSGSVEVELLPTPAVGLVTGPVRVPSKRLVCWKIVANTPGQHQLNFRIGGQTVSKNIAIGSGFMPTSLKRPTRNVADMLLHPQETPFDPDSSVQSIDVAFPDRQSLTSGTHWWIVYWFVISFASAFVGRLFLNVNI